MLDPINALAFSLHSNRGVYALLLGSGISRAAGIPTGWEITLELIRKVAAVQGEDCEPDPASWYATKAGVQPDYSDLLNLVAKTPAERQRLLRSYWEPSEDEREQGAKQPTKAHHAIAGLVRDGYVRVIITTNFDKLMELALQEAGVQPAVLSTVDHIAGAVPLVHAPCTVIKVHGDYLDTRMLNSPQELAAYPEGLNRLLDRVLDEYGLIVCGWSADWDVALRAAIERQPARRYSAYWASRGAPGPAAAELVARRAFHIVPIRDADTFVTAAAEQVQALADFERPHPLSTAAAVASLKRYLSEPKYAIQLHDLVHAEVDRVLEVFSGAAFDTNARPLDGPDVERRVKGYETACETLICMAYHAGYWSGEEQVQPWLEAMARLATRRTENGIGLWLELQRYPATIVLYAFGVGAVLGRSYDTLKSLLEVKVFREHRAAVPVVDLVPPWALFQMGGQVMRALPGMENRYAPLNDRLVAVIRPVPGTALPSDEQFGIIFDMLEVLIALHYAHVKAAENRYWALLGRYGYRREALDGILGDLRSAIGTADEPGPLATSGLIGATVGACEANIASFIDFVRGLNWH
jgi:hypothetical protein